MPTFSRVFGCLANVMRLFRRYGCDFVLILLIAYLPIEVLMLALEWGQGADSSFAQTLFGLSELAVAPLISAGVILLCDGRIVRSAQGLRALCLQSIAAWQRLLVVYLRLLVIALSAIALLAVPAVLFFRFNASWLSANPLWLVPAALVLILFLSRYALIESMVVILGLSPREAFRKSCQWVAGHRIEAAILALFSYFPVIVFWLGLEPLRERLDQRYQFLPGVIDLLFDIGLGVLGIIPVVTLYCFFKSIDLASEEVPRGGTT